jgi:hypothetical protein
MMVIATDETNNVDNYKRIKTDWKNEIDINSTNGSKKYLSDEV